MNLKSNMYLFFSYGNIFIPFPPLSNLLYIIFFLECSLNNDHATLLSYNYQWSSISQYIKSKIFDLSKFFYYHALYNLFSIDFKHVFHANQAGLVAL